MFVTNRNMKLLIDTTKPVDLRAHLESVVDDMGRMHRAAVHASAFVEGLQEKPVVYQEEVIGRMTYALVQTLELSEDADLAVAMVIAAVDEVKKQFADMTLTTSELLPSVAANLSEHYCSDW